MSHDTFEAERHATLRRRDVMAGLWPLFRPHLWHFAGSFVLLVIASGLMIVGPLLVKQAIDVDIAGRDMDGLRRTVLLYLAAQLGHVIVVYVMRNWLEVTGQNMMAGLKRTLFSRLMSLPMAFYDSNPPGRLLSRVENDTQALRMLFTTTAVMLVGDIMLFVGMFVAMALVSPRLTLVVGGMLPLLIAVSLFFQHRIHPIFVEVRGLTAEICSRITEFVQGMPILRAFDRRRWAAARFDEANRRKFQVEWRGERLVVLWFNTIFFLQSLVFVAILGIGGMWALAGLVTIGTLAMFMGYVRRFFQPLMRLSEQLATIQKALAAAERIFLLLEEPITIADAASPAPWPGLASGITFENVWFRYRDDGDWILEDVSFHLPARERWAVVGPTGSGKTTIVSLLLRFYEPQRGRILVDGVDIRELGQRDLRSHVGLVLQDIYLFPGSLEENLRMGSGATRAEIEAAAEITLATRFIQRLPAGWNTDLSERGGNLSMGERQLLAFTRAILHRPEFLILDEATSAVDPATEALISRSMERVFEGRTALIVAHRISTIRDCDRILVIKRGRIVEAGSHAELHAAHGIYRTLHDLQFREADHARPRA